MAKLTNFLVTLVLIILLITTSVEAYEQQDDQENQYYEERQQQKYDGSRQSNDAKKQGKNSPTQSKSSSEQSHYEQISQMLFSKGENEILYKNLLNTFQQINITSRIFTKISSSSHSASQKETGQKTIVTRSTTLILQKDYLKMYKNKLGFKLKFDLNEQIVESIKNNQTFVESTFFFVHENNNYFVEKQVIPVLGEFRHKWREGIEIPMIADLELLEKQKPKQMVVKNMDIYFFEIDQELSFDADFDGSDAFGVTQVFSTHKDSTVYYYPRPLAQKINTKLKENYIPLSELSNQQKHEIKINIKIGSYLFPLMMYTVEKIQDSGHSLDLNVAGLNEIILNDDTEIIEPSVIRYFKIILFEGSVLGWVFLVTQTIINMSEKLISIFSILMEIHIFKNALQYRGMSLYTILVFITIDLLLIVVGFGLLQTTSQWRGPLVSIMMGVWKLKMIGVFQRGDANGWYKKYADIDRKSFGYVIVPLLGLVFMCVSYPIIYQGYLTHNQSSPQQLASTSSQTSQSLFKYLLERLIFVLDEYRFILAISPQIILNFKLKSCNSLPWKFLISLILFYSVDNFIIPVSTQFWEIVFYLKEEIFLAVLLLQKWHYGNSLERLPIDEDNTVQKDEKKEEQNEQKEREEKTTDQPEENKQKQQ